MTASSSPLSRLPVLSFRELAEKIKEITVAPFALQVGAMDGVSFDVLNPLLIKGGWRGLLIEPLPDMFEQLEETYADMEGLDLVNCAIADHEGTLEMRRINPETVAKGLLPREALGIATGLTDRGFLSQKEYAEHAVMINVPCRTLQKLLDEYEIDKIDVMMIDTEGADWQIARQLDFTHYKPRLFCMEFVHLPPDEIAESCNYLTQRGYGIALCHEDPENVLFHKNLA